MSKYKCIPAGITYIDAANLPPDWQTIVVVNADTRELVFGVIEVNLSEGWITATPAKLPASYEVPEPAKVFGNFEILRVVEIESTTHVTETEEDSAG